MMTFFLTSIFFSFEVKLIILMYSVLMWTSISEAASGPSYNLHTTLGLDTISVISR